MSDGASARFFRTIGVFTLLGALAACSTAAVDAESVGTSEAELGEAAVVRFGADFEERVTGELVKGRQVRIVYDPARLPQCRGEQGGVPQWSISGAWKIGDGPVRAFTAAGLNAGSPEGAVLDLDRSGELQIWFSNNNRWGCNGYDSDFGKNYRFPVKPAAHEPGWLGNARYAIERQTCDGRACDASLRPVPPAIVYESWARQRAAVRVITFEVWKEGVTDRENPDLWRQLDVQVHARLQGTTTFTTSYVALDRRVGNDARYAIDLAKLDPIPGFAVADTAEKCPAVPLRLPPELNGGYVEATVELYATVNGVELRPDGGGAGGLFRVRYQNYADRFPACAKQ